MSFTFSTLVTCLLLAASAVAAAADTQYRCDTRQPFDTSWELLRQSPDMRIYRRHTASEPEAAARLRWKADPQALYELIQGYEHFADFIPNVRRSVILERTDQRVWVYQQLNFPAPVRDRHYVLESTDQQSQPATRHYRVEWRLSERFALPAGTGAVPPAAFGGCWDIRAAPGSGLEAVYAISLDPGGLLPRWITERAMQGYLVDLMTALQRKLGATSVAE
ncbi:MAG: cyclase [Thiogranum sp.]|nr:cyclase [Thiogranum sp.]